MTLPNVLVFVALVPVVIALVLGLANLLRGGSSNRSQMFMRWRVGLQFVAVALIAAVLFLMRAHG
ncbi:MAG: twin transmembrane helix small protein [Hyphomicrobiales bacterium]|nr:twin transmembrane helix small protein [Hyphomicrobiales bacterium]